MKFSEIEYTRPDVESMKQLILDKITLIKDAKSAEEQNDLITEINTIRKTFETMESISSIRHTIDTTDSFYDQENDFYNQMNPVFFSVVHAFYEAIINSKYLEKLKTMRNEHFFNTIELSLKVFSDEIIEDLQKENQLVSEYDKLIASAKIDFEGQELTLSQMGPYMMDPSREKRKLANEKFYAFMADNECVLDDLFDQLVKLRDQMAKKLGYENFVELGYARLGRTDFTSEEVNAFRKAVLEYITPISSLLIEKQEKRIGIDHLKYYDTKYMFKSGNPKPTGQEYEIVEAAKVMYSELSEETHEFFKFMTENHLMDLVAKKGKAAGGYCTFIHDYKSPFIFSNFNGTYGDVSVLTHEVGHAYQVYSGRHYEEPEFIWPTLEAAEISSMGMEFITWPWMKLFFGEDASKFKFMHLQNSLNFIPYGVSVDEFQYEVYKNPQMTAKERKEKWREIEKKYMPYIDYESNAYLQNGGLWQKQGHIYQVPFYYIDYTLAQIAAFEIFLKFEDNRESAWEDYKNVCKVSGSQSFLGILKEGNLSNPFHVKSIKRIMNKIEETIELFDDSQF